MRLNEGMTSPQDPGNLACTAPRPVEDTGTSSSCIQEHCSGATLLPPSITIVPIAG